MRFVSCGSLLSGAVLACMVPLLAQGVPEPLGKHEGVVSAVAFSPDGKSVVSSGHEDRTIRVWDRETGKERLCYRGHTTWAMCARFSPDGKTVASSALEETIRVWEAGTGKDLRVINAAPHPFGVAFAPDGKVLASAGHDRTVRVWDLTTGKQIYALQGFGGRIWQVAYAPDGKALAFSCEDGITRIVDAATGKGRHELRGGDEHTCAVAWSPDGTLLATGGAARTIFLWDTVTGKVRARLLGHTSQVTSVAFSPDGRNLVSSAYQEPAVRLWEVATGAEVVRFAGHIPWPDAVAYAPDGRAVVSAGRDAAVRIWDVTGRGGRNQGPPPTERDLDRWYRALLGDDPVRAHAAGWMLVTAHEQAVVFLKARLKHAVVERAELARVVRLLADLDADDYDTREKATEELQKLGELVEATLRQALEKTTSAEVRQRVRQLLERLEGHLVSPRAVPAARAVGVLDRIGTQAARSMLADLATGPVDDPLTLAARKTQHRQGR